MPSPRWIFAIAAVLLAGRSVLAADDSLRHFIDTEIAAGWKTQNLTPAPLANDAEFVRRVYLDLSGVIPTHDQARAFIADPSPDKRTKLIDRLLADDRYAVAQAIVWDQVLFGRDPPGDDSTRRRDGFMKYLRQRFAENAPYDQIVRELLRADGNSIDQGAPLFLVQFRNKPEDAAVAITRLFMGVQLQCARCHDHPTESWTQKDFYGVAAFFARLKVVEVGKVGNLNKLAIGESRTGDVLFSGAAKDLKPGMKGEPIKPRFLNGSALAEPDVSKDFKEPKFDSGKIPPKPDFSRKEKFAAWVAGTENPYFARAAVNRIWAQFMGRGLVDPVDDFTPNVEPTLPKLLDRLTGDFAARKYDIKWLVREIVSSESYQRSAAGASTDANPKWHERGRVRPLSAEELLASMRVATNIDTVPGKSDGGATSSYFTRYFGEPVNGRGVFQGSIDEHLFLNNSPDVQRFTQPIKGSLVELLSTSSDPADVRVERLFMSVLSRSPTETEKAKFVEFLDAGGAKDAKQRAASQAVWVLLNTAEFRFNR